MQAEETILKGTLKKPTDMVWTPPQNGQSLIKDDLPADTARQKEKRKTAKSWKNQVTDFMRDKSTEDEIAEDRDLWRLGIDRRFLSVQILTIS